MTTMHAQSMQVEGKVSLFNTYPANNIEVRAKKAKTVTMTGPDGSFSLECNEKDVVLVHEKAFNALSEKIDSKTENLEFNLVFKNTPKNRKIVVDNGNITREDLDYALENLMDENNDYCSYPDVFSLVKGNFPELDVRPAPSGEVGIYLRRGTKSLSQDSQTLYIIDGQRTRGISHLNPCEIAEIQILNEVKAAKYGAGGSNGALEIRTKRAR